VQDAWWYLLFITLEEHPCGGGNLTQYQLDELMRMLLRRIHFVPDNFVCVQSRKRAWELCRGLDEADVPYVALAIEMQLPLWTSDEKLKKGLRKKGFESFLMW
jgi:predicted nucleic acid-binding protein